MVMRGPGSPNGGPRIFTHPASAAIPTLLDNELEVESDDETPEVMGNEGIDECCLRSAEVYAQEVMNRLGKRSNIMSTIHQPDFCERWRKEIDKALAMGPEIKDPEVRAEMQRMAGNDEARFQQMLRESREWYEAMVAADRAWNECAEEKMGGDMFTASDIDGISWADVVRKATARDDRERPEGWVDAGSDWSLADDEDALGRAYHGGPAYTYAPAAMTRTWSSRAFREAIRQQHLQQQNEDGTGKDRSWAESGGKVLSGWEPKPHVLHSILGTDRHEAGHSATQSEINRWSAPDIAFRPEPTLDRGRKYFTANSWSSKDDSDVEERLAQILDDPKAAFAYRQPPTSFSSPNTTHRRKDSGPQLQGAHERAAFTVQSPFDPAYALTRWLHHHNVGVNERKVAMRRLIEARKRAGMDTEGEHGAWSLERKEPKGTNWRFQGNIPGEKLAYAVANNPPIDWRDPQNPDLSYDAGYPNLFGMEHLGPREEVTNKFLIPARERIRGNLTEAFLGQVYDWMQQSGQFEQDRRLQHATVPMRMKAVERVARPMLKPLNTYLDSISVDPQTGESEGLPKTLMDLPEEFRMELGRLMLRRRLAEDFKRQNMPETGKGNYREATAEEEERGVGSEYGWVYGIDPILSPTLNTQTGEFIRPKGVKRVVTEEQRDWQHPDYYDITDRFGDTKDNVLRVGYDTTDNPGDLAGEVYVVSSTPVAPNPTVFKPRPREEWDPVTAAISRAFGAKEDGGRLRTAKKRPTLNDLLSQITNERVIEHLKQKEGREGEWLSEYDVNNWLHGRGRYR